MTVYYDDSNAPSFDSLIDQGAAIWNSRVSNVQLVEGNSSNASLTYYEGTDPSGSYYYGDGHGSGYIFMDYDQANTYAPLRIVTHETGHALGLPDRYTQPCSKLMSGGGPGPSCTNPYPDSVEASEVNTLVGQRFRRAGDLRQGRLTEAAGSDRNAGALVLAGRAHHRRPAGSGAARASDATTRAPTSQNWL